MRPLTCGITCTVLTASAVPTARTSTGSSFCTTCDTVTGTGAAAGRPSAPPLPLQAARQAQMTVTDELRPIMSVEAEHEEMTCPGQGAFTKLGKGAWLGEIQHATYRAKW